MVVDESEMSRLGLNKIGDTAEVFGRQVRLVGLVRGYKSVGGPYVFCSLRTARMILPVFQEKPHDTMYILARCRSPEAARSLVERLRKYSNLSAFTSAEFSERTQTYWRTQTNAGIGMWAAAILGLMVGLAVTSQTLYAATVASLREYAVLQALGVPTWRLAGLVLAQSFWVGLFGITLAVPLILALAAWAGNEGARVVLTPGLFCLGGGLTLGMALLSGLGALRSLKLVEPNTLLR